MVPLTDLEKAYSNIYLIAETIQLGCFVYSFQRIQIDREIRGLDHKECLKRLVDYELETIRQYNILYKRLIVGEGCVEVKKREEEFDKIMAERAKMEPLQAYAREKLAREAGGDGPDSGQAEYHPLILFFRKAFIPNPGARYSKEDIMVLFREYFIEFDRLTRYSLMYMRSPGPIHRLKNMFIALGEKPSVKQAIQKIGLEIELKD